VLEVAVAGGLILGVFVRFFSAVAAVQLIAILVLLKFQQTRDFGLLAAALYLALAGDDFLGLGHLWRYLRHRSRRASLGPSGPGELVIVGGGFCGAAVARKLDADPRLRVTLVDPRDQWEYTPGIVKVPFRPATRHRLTVPFGRFLNRTRVLRGQATRVEPGAVQVGKERIDYDYLVLATGATYPVFLENTENVSTLVSVSDARRIAPRLGEAERVLVVGGGVLGTEVAAEIAIRRPDKQVVVAHGENRLLERNPERASNYAEDFLRDKGVGLFLSELVEEQPESGLFLTGSGREIRADLCIWCAGIRIETEFLKAFDNPIANDTNAVRVNEHLQVDGHPNLFCG
jgi:NADH dehydrogenase FAD-containing subunit